MKVLLNIKADTPNKNGIIYTEKLLAEAIEDFNTTDKGLRYITFGYPEDIIKVKKEEIVGFIDKIENNNGIYSAEAKFIDEKTQMLINENSRLCFCGTGCIDENCVCYDLTILYFALCPKEECA